MGDLNSAGSDFAPIVSPDGKLLFFTSDRPGGYGGQDIWMSELRDGEWSEPKNLGPDVNDQYNQGVDCYLTDDGKEFLYMTKCQSPEGMGMCDIFVSEKKPDGSWSKPKPLPEPINTKYSDANATFDYINNALYFVSTRPGGMEGEGPKKLAGESSYDIWMAERKSDGSFGTPRNLGIPVNTPGWEGVAFFHAADQTLYFSSDGHGGQGGADVFKSKRNSDGSFAKPEPVDYVNTPGNDIYLSIPAMGDVAYLSSTTGGGSGGEDLYRVPLNFLLPPELLAARSLKIPVARPEPKAGASILDTIYFSFDRSFILETEVGKLDQVVKFMNDNPQVQLEIAGHADSLGEPDYNLLLSHRRAKAVKGYLVGKGIKADRLSIAYYGEDKPAHANSPESGNRLNRRVELSIAK